MPVSQDPRSGERARSQVRDSYTLAQSSQSLPLLQGLDHHWEAADTFRRPAFESWLCPYFTVLPKVNHFYFLGLHFPSDSSEALPTEDCFFSHALPLWSLFSGKRRTTQGKSGDLEAWKGPSAEGGGIDSYWRVRGCVFIFPVC